METGLERHEPLYLKYRPQLLDALVGQPAVSVTLANAISHNRISHAYLFTGPRGTGKTSSARILAKSLNCQGGPTTSPCLTCAACQEIAQGTSPAVFEIDAASNNSVDDARLLIERAPLVAVGGRFKIYIIDECHMLSKEAFNALLKTIEEPPPQVIFVLATTEEHKVPPTIVSRCQKLMFRLLSQNDLLAHLRQIAARERIEIEEPALELIARRSGGGLRDALGLLDQASLLSVPGKPVAVGELIDLLGSVNDDALLEMSQHILDSNGQAVLTLVHRMLMEGREPAVLVLELARHFLNLTKASYIVSTGTKQPEALAALVVGSEKYLIGLITQAPGLDPVELSQMVEQLDRLEQTLRRTTQPAMHLEIGLLALCHRQDMLLIRQLAKRIEELESIVSNRGLAPIGDEPAAGRAAAGTFPAPAPTLEAIQAADSRIAVSALTGPTGGGLPAEAESSERLAGDDLSPASPEPFSQAAVPEPVSAVPDPEAAVSISQITLATEEPPQPPGDDDADLDSFWSELLGELQRTHIPTYSMVQSHSFPLRLNENELAIGVRNEQWQQSVEKRLDRIKAACQVILGRSPAIRVKIVSQPPVRSQGRPRAKHQSGHDRAPASAETETASGDPEASPASVASPAAVISHSGLEMTGHEAGGAEPRVVTGKAAATAVAVGSLAQEAAGGTLVREAYKLFEGPGSRLIG